MTRTVAIAICLGALPSSAIAQGTRVGIELTASAGATRVFRVEDESFGTRISPGAGLSWKASPHIEIGVEVNRAAGFEPRPALCAAPPGVTCSGTAREGVLSTTLMSGTISWHFTSSPRVQPFVIAGLGAVWSRTVSSTTFAGASVWTVTESEERDRGVGLTAGAGVRIPIGSRVVIRPEWRLYDGALLGRANLTAMRTSVGLGYVW